jgi:hypothetical protein
VVPRRTGGKPLAGTRDIFNRQAATTRSGVMFKRVSIGLIALLLATTGVVLAGTYTLHPSGFGPHSYASWKGGEGLPDSNGNKNQALYFQKKTATTTNAAGVVLIKGFEGMAADQLTGLSWDHRTDGHCGSGAPRWNIGLADSSGNVIDTVFLGCFAAAHSQIAPNWCHDEQPLTAIPAGATIRYLAIVFDEGTDNPMPQPAGCFGSALAAGFVYLDNITVETTTGTHVWTSASDNGNGGTTTANSDLTAAELEAALGAPLTTLLR